MWKRQRRLQCHRPSYGWADQSLYWSNGKVPHARGNAGKCNRFELLITKNVHAIDVTVAELLVLDLWRFLSPIETRHDWSLHRTLTKVQRCESHAWLASCSQESSWPLLMIVDKSRRRVPVLQPWRVLHSLYNWGPAAWWIAPSTPPRGSSGVLDSYRLREECGWRRSRWRPSEGWRYCLEKRWQFWPIPQSQKTRCLIPIHE